MMNVLVMKGCLMAPHLWSVCSERVHGISRHYPLGCLHTEAHKLLIDLVLHKDAGGGRAGLALVEEGPLLSLLYCQLHYRHTGLGGKPD